MNDRCKSCMNYGVVFLEDDSIDACMIDSCEYEPMEIYIELSDDED